ncbi:MAG: hypothetical protein AB8B97_16465 [Granulosicoccus sp.]
MAGSLQRWLMIASLLVVGSLVHADDTLLERSASDPFSFDPAELDPIRFTRATEELGPAIFLGSEKPLERPDTFRNVTRQTAFSFKLKPKLPNFSREGGYGLDLFDAPRLDVKSYLVGFDGMNPATSSLHNGLEYSAGVRLEHEDAQIDGTAYVSSSLLGLSYGRLGRLWYGAIDVNLEQFSSDALGSSVSDVLSLDVTTGRRFGITGLDANSPLWMLSVQGNLDVNEWEDNDDLEASSDWFINPSLFWQQPGFMFSAQMQVPMEFETLDDEGEPDYRLRAVFEKQFK